MSAVFKRRMLWVALCAALVGIVWASGAGSWPDLLRGMRSPTEAESFYRYVAQDLEEASICDKISWLAESPGGFLIASSYERSECYASIAGSARNPWLCWRVRRLGAIRPWEDQLTSSSCLRRAQVGSRVATGVSDETLLSYFAAMGYDVDTLHLEGVTPPVVSVQDTYRAAALMPDIVRRVVAARSVASHTDVEDDAYLIDMLVMASKDADMCMQIPEELVLGAQMQRFRDWCVFKLATDARDAGLCRRIPVRPDEVERYKDLAPRTAAQMTLRWQCEWQATRPSGGGKYFAEVPGDEVRIRRLLAQLDVEIPTGRDLPPQRVAEAYRLFLGALTDTRDPKHLEARQRFVRRVQQLDRG